MASILRSRRLPRPPANPSSLFLRLPSTYRSFHASPRPQYLETILPCANAALEFIHTSSGLPWALSLPLSALLLRITIVLPLSIYSRRRIQIAAANVNPVLQAWRHHFQRSAMKHNRGASPGFIEKRVEEQLKVKRKELSSRWGTQRWKLFMPSMIQPLVWLPLVETIRRMCGTKVGLLGIIGNSLDKFFANPSEALETKLESYDPSAGLGAIIDVEPSFAIEGILWFPNLLLPDPLMVPVLPMLVSGTMLLNVLTPRSTRKPPTAVLRFVKRIAVLLCIALGPLTMQMPTAILVYWFSSAAFGCAQNHLLQRYMPIKYPVTSCRPLGRINQRESVDLLLNLEKSGALKPQPRKG